MKVQAMRFLLWTMLALCVAACGGNSPANTPTNSAPGNAAGNAPVVADKSPQEVRDAYIAAMDRLDGLGMVEWLTAAEKKRSEWRILRGFATSRESSDSYTTTITDWKERNGYWSCSTESIMNLKDGGTHTLPETEFFVVKEGANWRVSWQAP